MCRRSNRRLARGPDAKPKQGEKATPKKVLDLFIR
jgi:hypothetical protein